MARQILDKEYAVFLDELKHKVTSARHKAILTVNRELILLYHNIGTEIIKNQKQFGWGARVIDRLSRDLKIAFREIKGFSTTNLKYMKLFAESFNIDEISQQAADQLPWFHIITILVAVKETQERKFYINKTIEHGWSRNILSMQIESNLFQREGRAITNFSKNLSQSQSDLAEQTLRNPYLFDFLSIGKEAHEREVEKALVDHIEKFLLELGEGFAFLGKQYHLQIEGEDFYLDLLFYHVKLHCYVVIELKTGKFKPEYAGKMNFYLSAVDDLLKQPEDNPSIGIIMCRSKLGILAEYTLRDMSKPIGLAEYHLTKSLPENLKTSLPTIEEIENELSKNLATSERNDINTKI